jgi:glycosyltransferase involved in cell wall biosynthesis
MPVYNGAAYIAEAIDSIIAQTFTDWELLIGDDASTDDTEKTVRTYTDSRISYYRNDENRGHTDTKYSLLDKSSGDYIAFLDADDVALPARFERQVTFLDENPEYGMCGTWGIMIDPQGKKIKDIAYAAEHEYIRCGLLFSAVFLQSSLMVRRNLFRDYYYDPEIPLVEDLNFECLLAKNCKLANIPEKLVKYRWHATNISNTKQETLTALTGKIFRRELVNVALYADDAELSVHLALRDKSVQTVPDADFMEDAWLWLNKLCGANQLCRTYNHQLFCATICFRWLYACKERKVGLRMFPFPVPLTFGTLKALLHLLFLKL